MISLIASSMVIACAAIHGSGSAPPAPTRVTAWANDPVDREPYSIDGYFLLDLSLFSVDLNLLPNRETFGQLKVSNLTGARFFYPGFRDFDIPTLGRTVMFTLSQQL